jgi:hypothetical protein
MSQALQALMSRYPQDRVVLDAHPRCIIAKVDVQAYGDPAIKKDADGSVSMLCGEPLIAHPHDDKAGTRPEDLATIHAACEHAAWAPLGRAQGAFCAVHFSPQNLQLTLIADKLCIRPLYYWISDRYVVFATAMRIMEGLAWVPKELDLRGIAEMTTLGIPLGTRTAYQHVTLMEAAEVIQISPQQAQRTHYWRWDDIKPTMLETSALLQEAATRFRRAVVRRNRGDKRTLAFLSGGLDSRGIVATLRSLEVEVHTFDLAPPGTLDQVLGAQFAKAVGTFHQEAPMDPDSDAKFATTLARAWGSSQARQQHPVPRPQLAWSGDGGSVGVGHVYITKEIVDLLRGGNLDAAVQMYLNRERAKLLTRLFKSDLVEQLAGFPFVGVRRELQALNATDPGRNFYLFLMLNDQRRHLADHFEHIDLHRLELQLPYYDGDFLELMVSSPIDLCLRHGFYNQWLHYMPPSMLSVPWQAYPGHEPCPLATPENLVYQWDPQTYFANFRNAQKEKLLEDTHQLLKAKDFPRRLLNKSYLHLATWAYRFGLRDTSHVLRVARTVYRYAHRCNSVV